MAAIFFSATYKTTKSHISAWQSYETTKSNIATWRSFKEDNIIQQHLFSSKGWYELEKQAKKQLSNMKPLINNIKLPLNVEVIGA